MRVTLMGVLCNSTYKCGLEMARNERLKRPVAERGIGLGGRAGRNGREKARTRRATVVLRLALCVSAPSDAGFGAFRGLRWSWLWLARAGLVEAPECPLDWMLKLKLK